MAQLNPRNYTQLAPVKLNPKHKKSPLHPYCNSYLRVRRWHGYGTASWYGTRYTLLFGTSRTRISIPGTGSCSTVKRFACARFSW